MKLNKFAVTMDQEKETNFVKHMKLVSVLIMFYRSLEDCIYNVMANKTLFFK